MNQIAITTHPNIALIKYWGKRNEQLFLPTKSSLSIGLDALSTKTTISLSSFGHDIITINGVPAEERHAQPVLDFLKFFRNNFAHGACPGWSLCVHTTNSFPTAAGLASSASGFAALALGLDKFFNLELSGQELSILARQGSGSACRSLFGGFVLWNRGQEIDGSDSFAAPLYPTQHWPTLRVIIVIVAQEAKKISSRIAMKNSIATSPIYNKWVQDSEQRLVLMCQAIEHKNFDLVGQLAEEDCLGMHATMHTSTPAVNFWSPVTHNIMQLVTILRTKHNIACYFTIDAGPNIKILCQEADVQKILLHINTTPGVECIVSGVAGAPKSESDELCGVARI